jgi:hypothetical protein
MSRRYPHKLLVFACFALVVYAAKADAQIASWKIGGSGLAWSDSDTSRVMVEIDRSINTMRPIYFERGENMFLPVSGWSELKYPRELDYIDGYQPRIWYGAGTNVNTTSYFVSPLYVDGERSTYNTARNGYWTIDIGVPVPASRFSFVTPTEGVRSDGVPLSQDSVPAYAVSISEETDPVLEENGYAPLNTPIANVPQNFDAEVEISFPQQYVRFVRYNRNHSLLDEQNTTDSNTIRGTIAEFILSGEGVPKRALYRSKILALDDEVNFGRIFWSGRTMRKIDGRAVEVEDGEAWVEVEIRVGRDDDPNIYHEYTDSGKEFSVSRSYFENELRVPENGGNLLLDRQPGIRASVQYDSENWSFWSNVISKSGARIDLRNGSYLQLQISLQSRSFDDWVELDSLWIEVSPPLADRVVGEVARLDDMRPVRGFTQVQLGQREQFVYDIAANFELLQGGFDGVRIRTGSHPIFTRIEIGDPPVEVEALAVVEGEDELTVQLPQRISRDNNKRVRIVFSTPVFLHATTFGGEVFDSQTESLPQPIEPGDAGEDLSTNDLRVLSGAGDARGFVRDLQFSTRVFTPNGDGVNDVLVANYDLFLLPDPIPVEWVVYDLQGRLLMRLALEAQQAGPQTARWDGRDGKEQSVAPGLYLVGIELRTELRTVRHLQPVGIAY